MPGRIRSPLRRRFQPPWSCLLIISEISKVIARLHFIYALPVGQNPGTVVVVIVVQANGSETIGSSFYLNIYDIWMEGVS